MSSEVEILETFFGALQGTISVLLVAAAGFATARAGICDHPTVKQLAKISTTLYLPCLIIEQMGPELTAQQLVQDWVVPVWGLASTILAHGLGWVGHRLLALPYWTIVACGRPNANALPILLLASLERTGVLDVLARDGESLAAAVSRGKSLLLLNAVVQQTLTFELAPAILRRDRQLQARDEEEPDRLQPGAGQMPPVVQDTERVGLLEDPETSYGPAHATEPRVALQKIEDMPDYHWPKAIAPIEKPLKVVWLYMNPPLTGAVIALVLGIVPSLHHLFFDTSGALYTTITQTIQNLGGLFVVLQTFIVGAELALIPHANPGKTSTTYVLLVRFVVMPTLACLFVWLTAGRGFYVSDPLVWFLLVLIPSGPSAMLLISVAELVDIDLGAIAGYLFISYLFSPFMAVVCSAALKLTENVMHR